MKQYIVIQDCYVVLDGNKPRRYSEGKIIEVRDDVKPPKRFFKKTKESAVVQGEGMPLSKATNRLKLNTGMAHKAPEEAKGIIDSPIMEPEKVSQK